MAPHPSDDLCPRASGGDSEAQAALWREHRRWVAAVLLCHRPPGAELEDLLQEVALSFVRGIGGLRDPERLRPWLRSIAVNAARSAARRGVLREDARAPLDGTALAHAARNGEADTADAREEAERALEIAAGLDPKYREPLLLRCVQGLSQAAIAAALELPETTVETRLARARRWLRAEMDRDTAGGKPWTRITSTS